MHDHLAHHTRVVVADRAGPALPDHIPTRECSGAHATGSSGSQSLELVRRIPDPSVCELVAQQESVCSRTEC